MASDGPNDSSSFDALWDFGPEEDDEPIPPALDPRGRGPRPSASPSEEEEEERDTLLPPLPHGQYVQQMMELGELDDPSHGAGPPPRADRPAPPGGPFGLVLAPENELLLSTDAAEHPPPFRPAPGGGPRGRAADAPRNAPPARVGSAGFRAPPTGLPVPRAPSIPPAAPSTPPIASRPSGALSSEAFDAFAALDSLDALDKPPSSRGPFRPNRMTPPGRPPPPRSPSSDRSGRITGTAGLRLRRTTPPPLEQEGDRVTPIAVESAPPSVLDALREMVVRWESKNYGGALVLAESVLVSDPDHLQAKRLAESCREKLGEKYLSSLGGREAVPRVCMSPEEIRDLSLDHRAGFLLSFIDGSMSIDEVLDVSSMPELDVLRMMFELRQQGAIDIDVPAPRFGRRQRTSETD
jgi:hypothetical protein